MVSVDFDGNNVIKQAIAMEEAQAWTAKERLDFLWSWEADLIAVQYHQLTYLTLKLANYQRT